MSQISISDRIQRFLDRKYRISKSCRTVHTYRNNIKRFENFANESSNMDINHLIDRILEGHFDPLDVLDDFYTYLINVRPEKTRKPGYSARTIKHTVITAKEFLNDCGCKIYSEDLKRKFTLPRIPTTIQDGLTKSLNREKLYRNCSRTALVCDFNAINLEGISTNELLTWKYEGELLSCYNYFQTFADYKYGITDSRWNTIEKRNDHCIFGIGIYSKDLSVCDMAGGERGAACYKSLALNEDWFTLETCHKMREIGIDDCYVMVAARTGDYSICSMPRVVDEYGEESCQRKVEKRQKFLEQQ